MCVAGVGMPQSKQPPLFYAFKGEKSDKYAERGLADVARLCDAMQKVEVRAAALVALEAWHKAVSEAHTDSPVTRTCCTSPHLGPSTAAPLHLLLPSQLWLFLTSPPQQLHIQTLWDRYKVHPGSAPIKGGSSLVLLATDPKWQDGKAAPVPVAIKFFKDQVSQFCVPWVWVGCLEWPNWHGGSLLSKVHLLFGSAIHSKVVWHGTYVPATPRCTPNQCMPPCPPM